MSGIIEWLSGKKSYILLIVGFKNILTTVVGFIPLAYVIIDEFNTWSAGDTGNVGALLAALAFAVVGWFTGKGKTGA